MTARGSCRLAISFIVAAIIAVLALSGCSGSDDSGASSTAGKAERLDAQAEPAEPAGGGEAGEGADADKAAQNADARREGADQKQATPAQAPTKVVPDDRTIIYKGTITIRVPDVNAQASAIITVTTASGGFVAGDNRTMNDNRSEARLVLRVPSDKFDAFIDGIGRLPGGKEESRSISTEDVTEQVVDLDARIATAQASVDRIRALLARAQTISEIVSLESEMSRREADLESLRARQRKLADLTAMSTITVVLLAPDAVETKEKSEKGFVAGLTRGWDGFVSSMGVLLMIIGALLPWVLVVGLPVWLVLYLVRRNAARRKIQNGQDPST